MTKYKVRVNPRDERIREIQLRATEAERRGETRQEFKFRSGREKLPLVVIGADNLLYRLENYRTRDRQLTLIAEGKFEPGFFEANRKEDISAQQAQHGLLVEQAQRGSGGTIKAIYDELERVKQQTDYLIVTRDGVVVNGNRRLAAMRELLVDEPGTYGSFAHVLCVVLPESATAAEILELEIGLQMQPDTKLPYEWTAIGRAARDLRLKDFEDEKIANLMNRSVADVQRAVTMFNVADIYLKDWLGRPDAFSLLEDTEQAFAQIATRNWGRDDFPQLRETTRQFDFFVIEHRSVITERAYELINNIELNPQVFLDQIALEWDIEVPERRVDEELEISFEDAQAPPKDYAPLVDALIAARGNAEDAERRMQSLSQACEIVGEQNRQKGRAALNFAKRADKALNAIDLRASDPATWGELFALLKACEGRCAELVIEIESHRA